MIADSPLYLNDQRKLLTVFINRIKDLFYKKKQLREDKTKLRGKLLMDKQILEEYRRRNEENHAYYQEQVEEYKENSDKKDSFIKQFEKKFNEVEIYVQREAKNDKNKYECFMTFEILAFINNNEMLHRRKMAITDEMKLVRDDINEILKENVELKKRDEYIDMSEEYDTQKSKYKSLINLYRSKIKFLERNKDHFKKVLESLNSRIANITSYNKDLNEKLKKGSSNHKKLNSVAEIKFDSKKIKDYESNKKIKILEEIEIKEEHGNEEETENNKSAINFFSDRRKDISLLDHSINNVKTPEFNINKVSDARENWDISCIENNDN
jgi:hypothetical protein